ncbi:hypothetical protein MYX76_08455 [Desulfobacterota bacterium AH_259_B03_O07]|nr:hypothetical protein [Desulfobacterota bacterium AH_259_B03_O07]
MAIITISEKLDGFGYEIARKTSQRLGFALVDSALILNNLKGPTAIDSKGYFEYVLKRKIPPDLVKKLIIEKTLKNNVVVLNLGGELLFRKLPGTLHIKVHVVNAYEESNESMRKRRKIYIRYLKKLYGRERLRSDYYDLQIKVERMDSDYAVDLIQRAVEINGITMKAGVTWKALQKLKSTLNERDKPPVVGRTIKKFDMPLFAHPSEKEFTSVLDFYRIKWEYEPRSFLLKADEEGNVKEEFTPDFYLPELDLYIELTTLKQKFVTSKNRKVKRLKKLYPDVNIKLFYGRDYNKLLQRFGIK